MRSSNASDAGPTGDLLTETCLNGDRVNDAANDARKEAGQAGRTGVSDGFSARLIDGAVAADQKQRDSVSPSILDYLRHAHVKSGRRPLDLVRDFIRLHRGRGRLSWPEYVQFGLYDRTRYDRAEQERFLGTVLHWPITHACCDMTWQATTEDKWLCGHILATSDIEVPQTLAVIDRSERLYPATHKISTARQLRDFLASPDHLPLFGKENRGICSFGAFLVVDADRKGLRLKGRGWLDYDRFLDRFVSGTPYLLQRLVRNHDFFDRYTDNLATVRICLLMTEAGPKIPFAILKIPSRENVADSFWRLGNLACDLDLRSGEILTARSRDPFGTTDHMSHPETGAPMIGRRVPMWDRVLDLACRCAPIFCPVRYQSMDIAIGRDGPVLVEVNTGGGFDLPQLASGKGFLTDEVREFFLSCGFEKL